MAKKSSKGRKAQKTTQPAPKPTRKKTATAPKKTARRPAQVAARTAAQKKEKPVAKRRRQARRGQRIATSSSNVAAAPATPYSFPPPVTARPEQLPLSDPNWTWEGFQAFCLDLLSRHPGTEPSGKNHHFGKQGDAQDGIDIFAGRKDGQHWGFQCKKVKRFTEADTKEAIEITTYKADKYIILLSIEAAVAVRKVVHRRRKWAVWDVRDISQRVRELPLEDQRQLLDTHFGPAWRKAFLGLSAVSTFPTDETFFGPLLDPSKLFNHAWCLVGRSKQVEQLQGFVDSQQHRVAILTGRGGIGKSKILHAFSTDFPARHKEVALRFVGDELPLTPESLDDLPLTPCVVVVDDAHRREDLGVLLSYSWRRTPPLKLIFSSRPQGLDHLSYLLRNAGFDPEQVLQVDPVTDLTREEVEHLARQVLGKDDEHLAERLSAVTKDSPLVTLIGGRLLKEKRVEPSLLERDEDFRATALSAFRDILVGDVGRRIEPELCRSLLNLIAAVAPIHPESQAFQAAAAEFLRLDVNRVADAIAVLERHGVLLRRGYSVRITPDVLADHLLYNACLTSQGRSTGFAQRVFNRFFAICPTQVFRNLAELDWRVRQTTGEETDLLAIAWHELRGEFEQSNNLVRCTMLDLVKEVAYYQPGQVLELVEVAIHHPAPESQSERGDILDPFGQEHVRRKLPEVIRRIACSIRHLPRCCDLLWELGRDDDRKLNPHPDHAMRVLTDLAGYDPDKHLAYNRVVLDAVARWLGAPDAHGHLHSPLDVLDPMLAKTGTSVHGRHHAIMIRSFHCTKEWTQPVRDEALKLVEKCLDSEKIKVVLRALRSLDEALREPTPYLNMTLSKDERAQWTPDRLRLLSILEAFAKRSSHPIILMRVQEILRIASIYGSSDEVKQKARNVASAIPDSFDLRLTRLLCQSYHDLCFPDGQDDDRQIPWQERQEQINRLGAAVASEFLKAYPGPEDGFQNLNDRFREMKEGGREVHPWLVLHAISEANGTYSDRLCELVLASPDCPLEFTFGSLVVKLRGRNEAHAVALIQRALQDGNVVLCRAVANEYWHQSWLTEPRPEDLVAIECIIKHTDLGVRRLGILALPFLAKRDHRAAIALALKLDIGDSDELADELCATFTREENGIAADQLTDAELDCLLAKLEAIQGIDGHFVQQFLANASRRSPEAVIQFLLDRIEREDARRGGSGRTLPFDGLHFRLEGVVESEKYQDFLRTIRDRMLGASGTDCFWLPKLFKEVSLNFSPASIEVLREWIDSGDPEKIVAAASIVSEADPDFVFDQVAFVTNLLDRALHAGNACYRRVFNYICNCARSGTRHGISGQPFPQDVALRDRARETASRLPAGTPAHRLFESLRKYAEAEIRDQIARDEELDD